MEKKSRGYIGDLMHLKREISKPFLKLLAFRKIFKREKKILEIPSMKAITDECG